MLSRLQIFPAYAKIKPWMFHATDCSFHFPCMYIVACSAFQQQKKKETVFGCFDHNVIVIFTTVNNRSSLRSGSVCGWVDMSQDHNRGRRDSTDIYEYTLCPVVSSFIVSYRSVRNSTSAVHAGNKKYL